MVVVGIDIGTQSIIVSHVGRGAVKILLNETSGRTTPTMVAYNEQARAIGVPALESFNMNYKQTVAAVNRFIGLRYSQIDQSELERLTVPYAKTDDDELVFKIKGFKGEEESIISPIQVYIALLTQIKRLTERETKTNAAANTIQCVIAIPPYYTDAQKRAVATAVDVAGMELMKLIPSTTAAAIEYGLYKDLPKENPLNLAYVEVGHAGTSVSMIQLVEGSLKVKSTAFDALLGARDFEDLLVNHFVEQIKKDHNMDLSTSKKAIFRLTTACEKLKKVLTGNTSAQTVLECIMNDKDIKITVTRDEFEEMADTLKSRFRVPVEQALKDSKLKLSEISAVQIIGGGTYIPSLRAILTDIFKQTVSTTQNAVEAVAKGCAIQGAMLSRQVRLAKNIKVNDVVIHSIDMGYSETKRMNIFTYPKHSTAEVYKITFKKSNDFSITCMYKNQDRLPPGEKELIASYTIRADSHVKQGTTPIALRLAHDSNGCITLLDAYYEKKVDYTEDKKVEFTEEEYQAAEAEEEAKAKEEAAKKEDKEDKKEGDDDKKKKPRQKRYKTVQEAKTRKEKVYLSFDANVASAFPAEAVAMLKSNERTMIENDDRVRRTEHVKNAIESYAYEVRDQLYEGEALYDYFSPEVCETFGQQLDDVVDWLYDEGEHETLEVYEKKYNDLTSIGNPGVKRRKAEEKRNVAIRAFDETLAHYQAFIISQDPAYAHIGAEARQIVSDKLTEATAWMSNLKEKQRQLKKYEDPVLTAKAIADHIQDVHKVCRPIENTPVPKKEEEPKKEETAATEEAAPEPTEQAATTEEAKKE